MTSGRPTSGEGPAHDDDLLAIDGVEISCVIGVYPEERRSEQSLVLSLRLPLDARRASAEDKLALTVDYARLLGELRFVVRQGAFHLLETAAEVVAAAVLAAVDAIAHVEVKLQKPRALGGNGTPSVTVMRARDSSQSLWTFPFGIVEVLRKTSNQGIYRVRLRPKGAVRLAADAVAFDVDADRAGVELGVVRRLRNDTDRQHSWLLTASPPLRLDMFLPGGEAP
jgi:dihydroneopterin aldolase